MTKKNNVTLSVVIPVYNVEKYIKDSIDSVLKQTKKPTQIILIDDGSTDNSGKICDEYEKEYAGIIKTIHQKNKGLSAARNRGISETKSDFILLLDSDDTLDLKACEKIYKAITSCAKEPDIIICTMNTIYKDYSKIKKHLTYENVVDGRKFLEKELRAKTMFYEAPHLIFKRQFITLNNLFFEEGILHEDQLFTIKALLNANIVKVTDIEFYNHIKRENSITTQIDQRPNAKSIIKICRILEPILNELPQKQLSKLLKDHCVDLYYKAYIDAKLVDDNTIRIEKSFLINNSFSLKNKLRTVVYLLNEKLFYNLENKRRRKNDKKKGH